MNKELDKYPHLKSYVESYKKGECEPSQISSLAYFFKRMCHDHDLDEQELFGWDDEIAEDFYSWGHNSRWANTFEWFLAENLDFCIDIAIELVKEYGDREIYDDE